MSDLSVDDIVGSAYRTQGPDGKESSGTIVEAELRNHGTKIVCRDSLGQKIKVERDSTGSWRSPGCTTTFDFLNGIHVCCQSTPS